MRLQPLTYRQAAYKKAAADAKECEDKYSPYVRTGMAESQRRGAEGGMASTMGALGVSKITKFLEEMGVRLGEDLLPACMRIPFNSRDVRELPEGALFMSPVADRWLKHLEAKEELEAARDRLAEATRQLTAAEQRVSVVQAITVVVLNHALASQGSPLSYAAALGDQASCFEAELVHNMLTPASFGKRYTKPYTAAWFQLRTAMCASVRGLPSARSKKRIPRACAPPPLRTFRLFAKSPGAVRWFNTMVQGALPTHRTLQKVTEAVPLKEQLQALYMHPDFFVKLRKSFEEYFKTKFKKDFNGSWGYKTAAPVVWVSAPAIPVTVTPQSPTTTRGPEHGPKPCPRSLSRPQDWCPPPCTPPPRITSRWSAGV
jgi:hypothetical protein